MILGIGTDLIHKEKVKSIYSRYEEKFFDVLVNSPYVKMFLISFIIAGGIYFFDKKSSFYKLLPLAFLGVVTIQLLMVLFPENIINSFF